MQIVEAALAACLAEAGLAVAESRQVMDAAQAGGAARELGFPVVMKAGGLLHKSDAGGVVLGLRTIQEVEEAAHRMIERIGPQALPLILQCESSGYEVLIGLKTEPSLGSLIVVGLGGVHTEVLDDVARALAPVDTDRARAMIEGLRSYPLMRGHRGSEPVDVDALARAVAAVSELPGRYGGIAELDLNPVMLGRPGEGGVCVDIRLIPADPEVEQRRRTSYRTIDPLLAPGSVAVVGVSDDPGKTGPKIFGHLLHHGFAGRVYPVHPAGGRIEGRRRYPSLSDLPEVPDLVSIAVPATVVPRLVREAAGLGVGGVIVHSSGFAEVGPSGAALQEDIARVSASAGMSLAGPNCMGLVSTGTGLAATLGGAMALSDVRAGTVALVSSSGALGSSIASRLLRSPGLSRWVHLGNEADVDSADYLRWLAADTATAVVGLVLENIVDGRRFVQAGRALAAAGKPVFVYNMARTESGHDATRSHTGALVGSLDLRRALIGEAHMVEVPTLRLFEDVLQLAAGPGLPAGNRLGAITASGGACTIIADEAEKYGIGLPQPSPECRAKLAAVLPEFVTVRNPLDVSAEIARDPAGLEGAFTAFLADERYDAILVQLTTNAEPAATKIAHWLVAAIQDCPIPVYVSRYGAAELAEIAMQAYAAHRIPVLDAPDRTTEAIGTLMAAGTALRSLRPERQ